MQGRKPKIFFAFSSTSALFFDCYLDGGSRNWSGWDLKTWKRSISKSLALFGIFGVSGTCCRDQNKKRIVIYIVLGKRKIPDGGLGWRKRTSNYWGKGLDYPDKQILLNFFWKFWLSWLWWKHQNYWFSVVSCPQMSDCWLWTWRKASSL